MDMTAAPRDARFDHTLAKWVKGALARGVRSFPELVAALPGAYPADVVLVLQRLRCESPSEWQNGPPPPPRRSSSPAGWPVEHPLDFDWRFTPESVRYLLDRCGDGSPLAFLGAPSLAREAA